MNVKWLTKSLNLWRRRERARKDLHTTAQGDLREARAEDVHPRQHLVDRRDLRSKQLKESRENIALRKRQLANRSSTGPHVALRWARDYVGNTESPPGSNKGEWGLTNWQRTLGEWLVGQPWCGTFVGTALIRAGVKGINSRVAAVVLILEDAMNGRNGFRSVVYRRQTGHGAVSKGRLGDLVGLYGESTHVAMIEKRVPGGYATVEGNTSPGASGSQANGGGVYRRIRPDSAVVYIVRPDWS